MKKLLAMVLILVVFGMFTACQTDKADKASQTSTLDAPTVNKTDNEQVIKAFIGDLSDFEQPNEVLKEVIKTYEYHCKPIEVDDKCSVVFTVAPQVKSCYVSRLSSVDLNDPDKEIRACYDSFVHTTVTDGVAAVYTGDWYHETVRSDEIRSFLVRTVDETSGNIQYYYFRVKYTPKDENSKLEVVNVPDDFDYSQWQIKHNGKIYKATDKIGGLDDNFKSIGVVMGTVEIGTEPQLNGFSNFGYVGCGYSYDNSGTLLASTPDGCLRFFKSTE